MRNYYVVDERGATGLITRFHPGVYTSQRKARHAAKLITEGYRTDGEHIVRGNQQDGYAIYHREDTEDEYRFVAVRWFGYF